MFLIAIADLLFTHDYVVDSLIAAAAIRGRRLFRSTCVIVRLLFTGGVFLRNTVLTRAILSYEAIKKTVLSMELHCSRRTMDARKKARILVDVEVELCSENESRSRSAGAVLSPTEAASSSSLNEEQKLRSSI